MIEQYLMDIQNELNLVFFKRMFMLVKEREGSLSAMEAFSVEVIHLLNHPTIGQFAKFIGISRSNASYKVNSLIQKGYILKQSSDGDKREAHLELTEKYYNYIGLYEEGYKTVAKKIVSSLPENVLPVMELGLKKTLDELRLGKS